MEQLRVIIAGGGTGGHIFPAVAIGHALQRLSPGTDVLFVGAKGKMEMEKVPQEGFKIVGLDIAGFNRSNMLKNLLLPLKIIRAGMQANSVIKDFKPDVVIGVGGYASFPVLNAAQRKGIPTLIQEQNSYAGKSNRILSRKADAICVAYEHMDKFFPVDKLILTGNPVRKSIVQSTVTRTEGQQWLELDATKKTVLIVGGSLGAKSINEEIDAKLDDILVEGVQVIWQTGKPYIDKARERVKGVEHKVKVFDFIREMDKAYAAADVVISRAGALAIAELCIVAKPVIFVPFPFAAEDHQTSNAMALVRKDAALIVRNDEVVKNLVDRLKQLLHEENRQQHMSDNIRKMAIIDADDRIAQEVMKITNR